MTLDMMEPGKWIRTLREEQLIKPSDIERITKTIAEIKGNTDFYISHSTLADIEAGSIPRIHKLFSLALCLQVTFGELLMPFGIDPKEASGFEAERNRLFSMKSPPARYGRQVDTNY